MTSRALLATILTGLMTAPLCATTTRDDGRAATILCYHIVESPQDPRMEISRETFREQMRYLAMTGYNVIPLRHLYEFIAGKRGSIPNNAVVITIDDGWRSTYTEVFPEMRRRKFPFTVFLYPKIIGQTAYALTWKQVRDMAEAGVDIQSHSLSHPYLTHRRHASLDDKAYREWLERELLESKRVLERETRREVEFLAYPYGDYDRRLASFVARAGYAAALTCDYGRVTRGSDPMRLKRVVIDKRMDFASFRHYLGAGSMRVEERTPLPGEVFEPERSLLVSAKIPDHKTLDPKSVGMALLSVGRLVPYSYDAQGGSIALVVDDAVDLLKGKYQRALIWATEVKSGKRVEASWTFRLPEPEPPVCDPKDAPLPTQVAAPAAGGAGSRVESSEARGLQRLPK